MEYPAIIAHRGLHTENFPENSLLAFENAVNNGIAIELDVRLTKDCKLVVFHDKNLFRMTGIDADISDFDYAQLSALTLKDTKEKIPLLTEVLKTVSGKVPIFIEIKEGSPVGILEKRLDKLLKNYHGDCAVMAFNPLRMAWFRKFSPSVTRGVLISKFNEEKNITFVPKYLASFGKVYDTVAKPDFVACDLRSVTMETITDSINNGCAFLGWTAKNEETLTEALKFCLSVFFENVDPQKAIEISKIEYTEGEND